MTKTEEEKARFVVCVDNSDYAASLELHKIYRSVPDKDAAADGDIRVDCLSKTVVRHAAPYISAPIRAHLRF